MNNETILKFNSELFSNDLHAKRILSLSDAVTGLIKNGSLAVHLIGKGLAQAKGLNSKHAIKQVDRLLSNDGINLDELFPIWLKHNIGLSNEIVISMDWTDFDCDNHSTLLISLQTSHGRNLPLIWKSYNKLELKGKMHEYEESLLKNFKEYTDENLKVTVVADRGFSGVLRFEEIENLGYDYIIRTKSTIYIDKNKDGNEKLIKEYIPEKSGSKKYHDVYFTKNQFSLATLVITKQKGMKAPWVIASSRKDLTTQQIIHLYSKRWGIETLFRDIKDYNFGMGLSNTHSKNTKRRDRLLFISALAIGLLTILGRAGEDVGLERTLKCNTVKTRSYSLWRQGCEYYSLLPNMKEHRLIPLLEKFNEYLEDFFAFKYILAKVNI